MKSSTYNIHEAKTNLSKIINQVEEGEVIYLARAGKVVAELKAVKVSGHKMKLGTLQHLELSEDWDSDKTNKEVEELMTKENPLNSPE